MYIIFFPNFVLHQRCTLVPSGYAVKGAGRLAIRREKADKISMVLCYANNHHDFAQNVLLRDGTFKSLLHASILFQPEPSRIGVLPSPKQDVPE